MTPCCRCGELENWATINSKWYCYYCYELLREKYNDAPEDEAPN